MNTPCYDGAIAMNLKRTTIGVVGVGALAAWFAGAMTPARPLVESRPIAAAPVDASGADLAQEIARLRARLRPAAAPHEPARNPFSFQASGAMAPRRSADSFSAPELADLERRAAVRLRLSGIAEDSGPGGPRRTAIIAGDGTLFLAKPGDTVTDRGLEYRVDDVTPDGVELTDLGNGSTHRLSLQ